MEQCPQVLDPTMDGRVIVEILPDVGLMPDEREIGPRNSPVNEGAGELKGVDADDVRGGIQAGNGVFDRAAGAMVARAGRDVQ
jgi:hypothetical protein